MGRPLHLKPRLMAAVSCIPDGHRVVDVGTDHARLPVYLLERGIASRVIATDIRKGPLERAARTIAAHRLTGEIELRLADGLKGVDPPEVDTIVIAGMGAETVIEILDGLQWPKRKNLILQPMTRPGTLEAYLMASGYGEPRRLVAREGRRVYTILHVGGTRHDDC